MLEALVLAGGASTRMGSAKAVLRTPDGRPFVTRIIETLMDAGVRSVTVVTGVHHEAIAEACMSDASVSREVRCVRNPDPERGQLSSLLVGLDAVATPVTEGLLVTLVDVPMVTADTIRRLLQVWKDTRAPIVRPSFAGAHGHPVIFDRQVFDELRTTPLDVGARAVVRAHADRTENVEVSDRGCLVDVDTPADYAQLRRPS